VIHGFKKKALQDAKARVEVGLTVERHNNFGSYNYSKINFWFWRVICMNMPAKNIESARISRRKWYANNKEHAKAKVKERRKKLLNWFYQFKSTLKCDCGISHPALLTFHHIDPKEKEVDLAHAAHNGWSKKRVMKEVSKCKVMCFHCHMLHHWNEKQKIGSPLGGAESPKLSLVGSIPTLPATI